jgi:hypothetical protein
VTGPVSPSASRTSCLLLLAVAAVVLLVLGLMSRSGSRVREEVDPSLAAYDAALALALESALAPGRSPPTEASQDYEGLEYVVLEDDLGQDEFARRLRTVPGWDAVVVIGPYSTGEAVDLDAAGVQSSFLRSRVRKMKGWPNDGIFDASVIRNDQVVSGFYVACDAGWGSFVVKR